MDLLATADESMEHRNNVLKTAILITGAMAGGGVLGLPAAVGQAGPAAGLALLVGAGLLAAFTGTVLGWCFQIATGRTERHALGEPLLRPEDEAAQAADAADDEYRHYPYIYIGRKALGLPGEVAVLVSQVLTLFGVSVVFLLLAADNLNGVWPSQNVHHWLYICALAVLPLAWLESPKDFWQSALAAVLATATVAYGVTAVSAIDAPDIFPGAPETSFHTFFSAFGTIVFAYGGAAIFPTLQIDMREPHKFGAALLVGFSALLAMYVPVAAVGYYTFGRDVADNVLSTKGLDGTAVDWFRVIITLHLLFAVIIIQNPVSQLIEAYVRLPGRRPDGSLGCVARVPPGFNPYRVAMRTAQMAVVLVLARFLPSNDFLWAQSLIGGTTTTLLTFVFPSLFYLALRVRGHGGLPPLVPEEWILHLLILAFAVTAGVSSTQSAWRSRPF